MPAFASSLHRNIAWLGSGRNANLGKGFRIFAAQGVNLGANPPLRFSMLRQILIAAYIFIAVGCGSGGGTSATVTPPVAADPWADVIALLERDGVDDLAFIVGDARGELLRYEKGAFSATASYPIASASKWLTSATIVALVEQGVMALDDPPQQYLSYWSTDPADPRSRITLAQLLSFTAGFHRGPGEPGCIGDASFELQACVQALYAAGVDAEPGTTYYYGPVHMQVAAAMAEVATGQAWSEVVRLTLGQALGLSVGTGFVGRNPRASGAAVSTAVDYAAFLQAQLAGTYISTGLTELVAERLTGVDIVFRPATITENNVDWYYGLGVWRECNKALWDADCAASVRVSSPGAFGWYPWIDVDADYYAVLAVEDRRTLFATPSAESVALGTALQPLIEAALAEL